MEPGSELPRKISPIWPPFTATWSSFCLRPLTAEGAGTLSRDSPTAATSALRITNPRAPSGLSRHPTGCTPTRWCCSLCLLTECKGFTCGPCQRPGGLISPWFYRSSGCRFDVHLNCAISVMEPSTVQTRMDQVQSSSNHSSPNLWRPQSAQHLHGPSSDFCGLNNTSKNSSYWQHNHCNERLAAT